MDITKKTLLLRRVLFGISGVSIVASISLAGFAFGNTQELESLHQERIILQEDLVASQSLAEFTASQQEELIELENLFPDQETIVLFLQDIEMLVQAYDRGGTVRFSALQPVMHDNQLSIPLTINLRSDLTRLADFSLRLEKIPYFVRTNMIELRTPQGHRGEVITTIHGRLYVSDPFDK